MWWAGSVETRHILRTHWHFLSPTPPSLCQLHSFRPAFPQMWKQNCYQFLLKTHLLIAWGSSSSTLVCKFPGNHSDWQAHGHMPIPEPITVVERWGIMIGLAWVSHHSLDKGFWRGVASSIVEGGSSSPNKAVMVQGGGKAPRTWLASWALVETGREPLLDV